MNEQEVKTLNKKNMTNLKDKLTNWAGALGAIAFIGGSTIASLMASGVKVPTIAIAIIGACGAASAATLGWLSGKNADGTTKTNPTIQ
jgi:hypothetical protein